MERLVETPGGILVPVSFSERQAKPEFREVATTADGRDITRGFVDGNQLQQPADSVLRMNGASNYRLYEEVLRDDQVAAVYHQRRLAVTSREWDVMPGGKRRIDKAAADFLHEQVSNIGWDRITGKMHFGVFYGYAVAEALYARDGNFVALEAIKVRDRSRFGFDGLGRLRLKTFDSPEGELLPERKFWSFATGSDHDDEPYGLGLAHWLYWPVFFKRSGMKFWLIFLDRFGQPTATGTYPANATADEKSRLLRALAAIHTDSGIIFPEGMKVGLLEAARSGTADYTSLYDRMDRAIAKVTMGQVASSEGTPGRLGGDDLQGDVRADLVKADADLICESFNRTIARWLTDWNFPGAAYPEIWRNVEEAEDLKDAAERDEKLVRIGFKPTLKRIHETYGDEYEQVPLADVRDAPGAGASGRQPLDGGGPAAAEFAAGSAARVDTADAQTDVAAREGDPAVEDMVAAIRKLLDEAVSLEDFRDRLLDAWPNMKPERFAQVMGDALTAAALVGRFDILEQARG